MDEHRTNRTKTQRASRLAWRRRPGRLEPAAGQDGRLLSGSTIRRNGRLQFVGEFVDVLDAPPLVSPETSILAVLRRRLAKARAQYRLSGAFTERELTIMDLAFDGLSLNAIGNRIGMTRQGVEYHVQRLMTRVVLFRNFWRYKNRIRGRK